MKEGDATEKRDGRDTRMLNISCSNGEGPDFR